MKVDWLVVATIAGPVVAAFLGAWLERLLASRPRVVSYLAHSSAVDVQPTEGPRFAVHTHAIVVRNAGRRAATNIRLGHTFLPNFSVYPAVPFERIDTAGDGVELLFNRLVPQEQITVSYLYYPPVTWQQINSYTKFDEGFARIMTVLPTPQPPRWVTRIAWFFIIMGIIASLYLGWQVGWMLWRR
jgi:hypothetical protein